jgi:hypothetical protein
LSVDDFDKQAAQLPLEESVPENPISRLRTPTSDEEDDLALALRLSLLTSDDFDEQVARLHRMGSVTASEKAYSSTPPNETGENDLGPALNLSQWLADILDEQVSGLDRRRDSRTAIENSLAPPPMATSLVQVWTTPSLCISNYWKFC